MTESLPKKSHTKLLSILLLIVTIITAMVIYFGMIQPMQASRQIKIDGVILPAAQSINNFKLTDNTGKPFNKESLMDHWTFMFFGFTNCGMVCPTTMSELNKMYLLMQKKLPTNQLPQIVMVSVDPDVDTVVRMNGYVKAFNPNFIGARANINETVKLEKQLHIAAAKIETDQGGQHHYTINHTADILVFNPQGELYAFLSYPHQSEQMVKDYKLIISKSNVGSQ